MNLLLDLFSVVLERLLFAIERFHAGWKISLRHVQHRNGNQEIKLVRWRIQRLLRGIRYVRGKEGVPLLVCVDCGHTEQEHRIVCPKEVKSGTKENSM